MTSVLVRGRPRASAVFWTAAVSFALSVFFVAQPVAHAGPLEDFLAARERYEAQDWQGAIDGFEPLVGGETPRLESLPLVLEARQYLATAYLFVGREGPAVAQLERLLAEDPSYQIDAAQFPREVVQLFERVRQRLAERREAQAERARLAAEVERLSAENRAMREELEGERIIEVPRSQWLVQIPFGVGQFENGEEGLGWFFFVTEALALAGTIVSSIVHLAFVAELERLPAGADDPRVDPVNLALSITGPLSWSLSGAFGILLGSGLIQANIAFTPTRSVRVPGRAVSAPSVSLQLSPVFVGLSGTF